jgi:hypothetical protein
MNELTPEEQAQLDKAFTYHAPKAGQPELYTALRHQAKDLARSILLASPPSRERAIAITNLEQSIMWANAAIARNS